MVVVVDVVRKSIALAAPRAAVLGIGVVDKS